MDDVQDEDVGTSQENSVARSRNFWVSIMDDVQDEDVGTSQDCQVNSVARSRKFWFQSWMMYKMKMWVPVRTVR
jgi:hypothetical protein